MGLPKSVALDGLDNEVGAQQKRHVTSFGERFLGKAQRAEVGRIGDDAFDAGHRRQRQIIGDPTARQLVILDVGGDHGAAEPAQQARDRTAAGTRLLNPVRQMGPLEGSRLITASGR
jgi:hypothetical protein